MRTMPSREIELDLLEKIASSANPVRQRDLARIIGLSLGMTNAIIKRLVQKGMLKIQKVNNRNIRYLVSPQGMERIALRSYRYFRRTIRNVINYKEAVEDLLQQIAGRGYRQVVLVGPSELDFIVEHLCGKHGLGLFRAAKAQEEPPAQVFQLYSENQSELSPAGPHSASLRRIILLSQPRSSASVAS